MIAATPRRWHVFAVVLALCPRAALAGECPSGVTPFPSHLADTGTTSYANLFDVTYHGSYKVIKYSQTLSFYSSSHPTKAGEPIPEIVLYQCGTPRPEFSDKGITTSGARYFEIPIQRATIAWGGSLPFFELLSVTEAIHLIDMSSIASPCAQLLEKCMPGIHMSQYDPNFSATASNNSVVFTDSFGTGYSNTDWDVEFQISLDPGMLNRAEWIRYVALFFNMETKADEIFSKIEANYNALTGVALQLSTDKSTEWQGRKPSVLWVNHQPETCADPTTNCENDGWTQVDGSWCHCGAVYKGNNAHYKRNLVQDAGGRLVSMPQQLPAGCTMATNNDGSQTLECTGADGLASFKAFLAEADVIVDESYIADHDTTTHDFEAAFSVTAAEVPALARSPPNIFRYDGTVSDPRDGTGSVGNAWLDDSKAQPQQLLAGMMEMLWSTSFHSPCGLKYFRRAIPGQGQSQLGHDDCPLYDEGGDHNCDAIHDHLHEVPQCMPPEVPEPTLPKPTTTSDNEVSSAVGAGLSSAIALSALRLVV